MTAVLYQFWRSSASWRVRWALAIKRIPFESVVVDLGVKEQMTPEHRRRNPMGHVPALLMDGHHLAESVAIIEYLDERFPEPRLYPSDPLGRARVRQIVEHINSGIQPLQNTAVYLQHSAERDAQHAWCRHFNQRGLTALEHLLTMLDEESGTSGPFAAGDTLTAADLCLVPQVYSARRFHVDLAPFPRLLRAEAAALATAHARGALPENQPGAPPAKR